MLRLIIGSLFATCSMTVGVQPVFAGTEATHADSISTDLHQAKSNMLAGILNSEWIIIGDDKSDVKAEALMLELMASDPELIKLEQDYPGVAREMAKASLPITSKYWRQRLPDLHARQSALYRANFSESELDVLIEFYSSPTGQKMITAMLENIKPDAMMEEAKGSEDFRISADSALKDISRTVPSIMDSMNDVDVKAIQALMKTGIPFRMQKIGPQTQKIALDWMNESAPGEDTELEAAALATIARRKEQASK
jgi:Uncharacterized protein conserved in bacteria (DUF2059)